MKPKLKPPPKHVSIGNPEFYATYRVIFCEIRDVKSISLFGGLIKKKGSSSFSNTFLKSTYSKRTIDLLTFQKHVLTSKKTHLSDIKEVTYFTSFSLKTVLKQSFAKKCSSTFYKKRQKNTLSVTNYKDCIELLFGRHENRFSLSML